MPDDELLRLTRENNIMLRQIIAYINQQIKEGDSKDFVMNVFANLLSTRISGF